MLKLHVIIASTRPGRVGPAIGNWFHEFALKHGTFEVELVDLAEVNLPLLDEAAHPMQQKYEHEHTKRWSASVDAADAFVFVTPEYNFSSPASLVNALDYLYIEWNYKPVAFVSYGGQSGGIRSVQMTKQIAGTLKMVPIVEAVAIPFFSEHLDEQRAFVATASHEKAAGNMLTELLRWAEALKPLRAGG